MSKSSEGARREGVWVHERWKPEQVSFGQTKKWRWKGEGRRGTKIRRYLGNQTSHLQHPFWEYSLGRLEEFAKLAERRERQYGTQKL